MREARRQENERRIREEQEKAARDAEAKRAEEAAQKEAEKEARLAKLLDDRMREMDSKREEDNKKIWERLGKGKDTEVSEGEKFATSGENKKRGQEEIAGAAAGQSSTPRKKADEVGALDAGLLLMNIDNVQRTQAQLDVRAHGRSSGRLADVFASVAGTARRMSGSLSAVRLGTPSGLGFDRVREGTKAVVANPGPGGRRQYRSDMERELMAKYKNELVDLCKKDKIKYHNKKQAVDDLTAIRVKDAYGDLEEEEEEEEEENVEETTEGAQEENPS
ncbi:hypothetical protein CBR_g30051 [Chara braunii]|uniref:Uncharacterized protein n=1 Tax=Chara braunii TaxID=69332 RepID=A0A388LBV5_CHABU|nr:hypothetical protein CBR_g30051 [Chara braunii]|eukprot:GBG79789.1 hypothetical protein CBR_g30051 [Chara braunii]